MHQRQPRRPWHRNTRQQVLLEYANLKDVCPEGVYVSLTPGNPTRWSGVLFVRKGPYAPSILRFLIAFPSGYPGLPPLVTFITDIFHPLVTPLTTYTYTTGSLDSDPVSATDEERLPPGGFSLSHAFPHWYGRSETRVSSPVDSSRDVSATHDLNRPSRKKGNSSRHNEVGPQSDSSEVLNNSIMAILDYLKRAFDDEELLDGLPLQSAANLGAWKAWHAHRRSARAQADAVRPDDPNDQLSAAEQYAGGVRTGARRPGEWSWDGVWKERVKRGVEASISDQVVFGAGGGGGDDDIIHFSDIEEDVVCEVKGIIYEMLSRSG